MPRPPKVHLSRWTKDGTTIWQVIERGMPISRELDDAATAVMVYQTRYLRGLRWSSQAHAQVSDIPEDPTTLWDGDRAEWRPWPEPTEEVS